MSIPNLITLARIIMVPVVFWLVVSGRLQAAFYVFLAAGISDAVDGFLAKRFNWQTELGAYLDPMADKLLLVTIFLALGFLGALPSWLVIAVVSRDILIVLGVLLCWIIGNPMTIKPYLVSKANTVAQIMLIAFVLADDGFGLQLETVRLALIWLTAALTLASLVAYLHAWILHMSRYESDASNV